MQPLSIVLIAAGGSEASRPGWWDGIFRHWPAQSTPPKLELLTAEQVLSDSRATVAIKACDAAIVAPVSKHSNDETCVYRVLDVLQQATVPALMLVDGPLDRLDEFHPGSVLAQALDSPPQALAGMVYALAQRQGSVRALDQSLKMAHSFQGETAAEIDRLHGELLLAARVQRDFLPKHMPVVDGVECGVLFRPAGFVSGDTYDVCRLDEFHVGFFLADAMGHGVPAALMTLYISGSFPRKEIDKGGYRLVPPAESLRRLNRELHHSIAGPARFVTAICGIIDTRTGLIDLACTGHPPPLRVSRHGVRAVDVSGMLLGVVEDFEYQQTTSRLEEDELLVIHSDGIEAAFSPTKPDHSRAGNKAYLTHLASMRRGESLDSLLSAMERLGVDLDNQAGSFHQDDDLTILAFETTSKREPMRGMPRAEQADRPVKFT